MDAPLTEPRTLCTDYGAKDANFEQPQAGPEKWRRDAPVTELRMQGRATWMSPVIQALNGAPPAFEYQELKSRRRTGAYPSLDSLIARVKEPGADHRCGESVQMPARALTPDGFADADGLDADQHAALSGSE